MTDLKLRFTGYVSCGHALSKTIVIPLHSGAGVDVKPRVVRLNFCASCWTLFKKGMQIASLDEGTQVNLTYGQVSAV